VAKTGLDDTIQKKKIYVLFKLRVRFCRIWTWKK